MAGKKQQNTKEILIARKNPCSKHKFIFIMLEKMLNRIKIPLKNFYIVLYTAKYLKTFQTTKFRHTSEKMSIRSIFCSKPLALSLLGITIQPHTMLFTSTRSKLK